MERISLSIDLEVPNMKEYKVINYKGGMGKKMAQNLQEALNEMASQGWEFVQKDGLLVILERDKN